MTGAEGMTDRPDAPAPMRRRGPRPLPLLLALAASRSSGAAPDAALVRGIAAYRRHPYRRTLPDPPAVWAEGGSRLLDYGGDGPLVLVVPSLVNRAYILDLAPGRSMLRGWAAGGVHPVLLDWGWPGAEERRFDLTSYIAGRLRRAMEALPGPLVLAGYCMGGLFALAAALRQPERVRGLLLLATPWDFHAPFPVPSLSAPPMSPLADGALPVDAIQAMFTARDVDAIAAKYRSFGTLDQGGERARSFVALEDWLSDGVPLAAPVAAECLAGWHGANTPATGQWRVAGEAVDPAALRVPALVALTARDRVVPPESAAPLAHLIPGAAVLRPALGHVGMIAGSRAEAMLWQPAAHWLRSL